MRLFALVAFLAVTPVALAQDAGQPAAVVANTGTPIIAAAPPLVMPAGSPAVPDPGSDPTSFASQLWMAFEAKDWGKLLFFGITGLVWALRKWVGPKVPALMTAPAGVAMNFAIAFSGMLMTSWAAGTKVTPHAIFTSIYGGFIAAGGWTILKNLWEHFVDKGANPAAPAAPAKPA
jgi:hypothetical protein